MPFSRQSSFIGGEIAPDSYERTDLDQYFSALRLARNCFVTPRGAIMNRAGTEYVNETKNSANVSRLIPFIFTEDDEEIYGTQNYALEFGDTYIRFYKNGELILSGGSPYEIVSPYGVSSLENLKFSQSGDTLFLTHRGYRPRQIVRTSDTSWALSIIGFDANPTNLVLTMAVDPGGTQHWTWIVIGINSLGATVYRGAIVDSATGGGIAKLTWADVAGIRWDVFRAVGTSSKFGYVGTTAVGEFYDDFTAPDYAYGLDGEEDYFNLLAEYPAVVGFFEQRSVWGNLASHPLRLLFSESGNLRHVPSPPSTWAPLVYADAPISIDLSSRRFEEIRALISLRSLLVLTSGSHWTVNGAQGGALMAGEIPEARVQYVGGVSWLDPLEVGSAYLAVQSRGNVVRELAYDQNVQGYSGKDVTEWARHFFDDDGLEIVSWCYAREPYSIVWAARSDGVLIAMTYSRESGTYAWHRHDIAGGGVVESMISIPEGDFDAVYMIVRRVINGSTKRYVERFAVRRISDVRDGIFLDSAVSSDGRNIDTTRTMLLDHESGWTAGSAMDATINGAIYFTAAYVGRKIVFNVDDTNPVIVRITSIISGNKVRVEAETPVTVAYRNIATTSWGISQTDFTGLSHLEGKEVMVCADGAPQGPYTVVGGAITLEEAGMVVHVGLAYPADIETLDLASRKAESKVMHKNVSRAWFSVHASRGLYAGEELPEDDDSVEGLQVWDQRDVGDDPFLSTDTETVEIIIKQSWNKHGRVVLRQLDPLPLTILAIVREFEAGDP